MRLKKIGLFLSIILFETTFSQGNVEWSLQQCIEYALKNNIQLKQQQINTDAAKIDYLQSKAQILPSINANASHNYNYGRNIDPTTYSFTTSQLLSQNLSANLNLPLFNGLQNYYTIKQNQANVTASKYDLDKLKNDISLNVASSYLQVLFDMELIAIAQNQLEITKKQLVRVEQLLAVGSVAKSNLLDVQAQLASEELTITNAQNRLDLSYLTLAQLLDLDSIKNFRITKPDIIMPANASVSMNTEQIYNSAVSSLPEIKSAWVKLKSSEHGLSIAKGRISPRLSLNGSIGSTYSSISQRVISTQFMGYYPNGDITSLGDQVLSPINLPLFEKVPLKNQFDNNLNKSIGFQLSIPIFNSLSTYASIKKAQLSVLNSKYTLNLAENQLRKTIEQAYLDASAALKKHNASIKSTDALRESYKYAEEKFTLGAITSFDYSESKNKLIKAESELLQAKYDYVFKTKILDFYLGKPITL